MKKFKLGTVHVLLGILALLCSAMVYGITITWSVAGEYQADKQATKEAIFANQEQIKKLNTKDSRRSLTENYERILTLKSLYDDDYGVFKGEAHMSSDHQVKLEELNIIRQGLLKDLGLVK